MAESIIFNVAKGRIAAYADLAGSNDAFLIVPLEATALVADATMRTYTSLNAILAGASNEQTTMGRKLLTTGITSSIADPDRIIEVDDPLVWTSVSGNDVGALVVCYVPDTTIGSYLTPDATRDGVAIPLSKHDFAVEPDGDDITAQFLSPLMRATQLL